MDSFRLWSFSDWINSRDPKVMRMVTSSMALVIMVFLLFINEFIEVPEERGFSLVTVSFMLTICLGVSGVVAGLLGLLDPEEKRYAVAGTAIGVAAQHVGVANPGVIGAEPAGDHVAR